MTRFDCLVVGSGPAGLMAADVVSTAGHSVLLIDTKPSFGRKFLMAGKSGLNLTMDEAPSEFAARYLDAAPQLQSALGGFGPNEVVAFSEALGQETFVGSSRRVFPKVMKASPFLRAWLARLAARDVQFQTRTKWLGYDGATHHLNANGETQTIAVKSSVFAMGGASWARLGSDGAWAKAFDDMGTKLTPFAPSNIGVRVTWSDHMKPYQGHPLKAVQFKAGGQVLAGEAVITRRGLEGTAIYNATPALRKGARLMVDLLPNHSIDTIGDRLLSFGPKTSLANQLRKIGLSDAARALLMEFARPLPNGADLARAIKNLEIRFDALGELDEAISTVGGLSFDAMNDQLMLKDHPGLFCAGEMLDWDAPTGGYLITACMATGHLAGTGAVKYLQRRDRD